MFWVQSSVKIPESPNLIATNIPKSPFLNIYSIPKSPFFTNYCVICNFASPQNGKFIWVMSSYGARRKFFSLFLCPFNFYFFSTEFFFIHRLSQILFRHGNPRLFKKDTAGSALILSTALRDYGLLAQVHCLVCFLRRSMRSPAVSILCIALRLIKPFPSRSQPCLF